MKDEPITLRVLHLYFPTSKLTPNINGYLHIKIIDNKSKVSDYMYFESIKRRFCDYDRDFFSFVGIFESYFNVSTMRR